MDYIISLYNNKESSDFQIIDKLGNILYLHKLILSKNDFFKTYFASPLSRLQYEVCDINIVHPLLYYIYTGKLFTIDKIILKNFMDLCIFSQMWFLDELIDNQFRYLMDNYSFFLNDNPSNIYLIDKLFGDYVSKTHKTYEFIRYNRISHFSTGIDLRKIMLDFIQIPENYIMIPNNIIEYPTLFDELDILIQIQLIIKKGDPHKLNEITKKNNFIFQSLINESFIDEKEIYSFLNKFFNTKIISHLLNSKYDISNYFDKYSPKQIIINNFYPFNATLYILLGRTCGINKKNNSILLIPRSKINKEDKLYIKNQTFIISNIYYEDIEITDTIFPYLNYNICINWLFKEGTKVYKVFELENI